MNLIYVVKQTTNEYGERHIDKVVPDQVLHHKSGIYVTMRNGFVKDKDVMMVYTAAKLKNLLMENAYNGYYSRELHNQYKIRAKLEQRMLLQHA